MVSYKHIALLVGALALGPSAGCKRTKEKPRVLQWSPEWQAEHPGRHLADSPIVGSRAHEYAQVQKAFNGNLQVEDFLNQFNTLELLAIIPVEHGEAAQTIAVQKVEDHLKPYKQKGITAETVAEKRRWSTLPRFDNGVWRCPTEFLPRYGIVICDVPEAEWYLHTVVANSPYVDSTRERVAPEGVFLDHEISHLELWGKENTDEANLTILAELIPVVETNLLIDELYKKVMGLPLDEEVTYGKVIIWGERSADTGEIAHTYRGLVQQYGSVADAVVSPESVAFLTE